MQGHSLSCQSLQKGGCNGHKHAERPEIQKVLPKTRQMPQTQRASTQNHRSVFAGDVALHELAFGIQVLRQFKHAWVQVKPRNFVMTLKIEDALSATASDVQNGVDCD